MSIRFYCGCGKHLRAREELAGMRTTCPACGSLVGIPALQPTHRGGSALPLSVEEWETRRRRTPAAATAVDEPTEPATRVTPAEQPRRRFRDWLSARNRPGAATQRRLGALEKRWYQCLAFPYHAHRSILPRAVLLTAMTAAAALHGPSFFDRSVHGEWDWLVWAGAFFLVGGFVTGFFHCVLASAAAGEVGFVRRPGFDVLLILRSLVIWLVTFMAGPALFAAAAFVFWFHSGDFLLIDWLILGELAVVAMSYWLLLLLAVHQSNRLRDANPQRAAELVRRLGWRLLLAAGAAALLVFAYGVALLAAIVDLHAQAVRALVVLVLIWDTGLCWAAFFLRLLGVWCFLSCRALNAVTASTPAGRAAPGR